MKKIFIVGLTILMMTGVSQAAPQIWFSSHTETADTTQNLCKGTSYSGGFYGNHGNFHAVCIDSATVAASTFIVYNSSGAASNMLVDMDATKAGCNYYDIAISSGLTYSNSSTAHVTILYQCY
jgi:hypothetical protein